MTFHRSPHRSCPLAPLEETGARRLQWIHDFVSSLAPGEIGYAVFDGRQKPDFRLHLDSLPGVESKSLWDDSTLAEFGDIAPQLITLRVLEQEATVRDELWLRLAQATERPFALSLWASSMPFEAAWTHFARYREYRIENSPEEFVLHFYDARVLERLLDVLMLPQQQTFLRPFSRLAFLDRHGTRRSLTVSAKTTEAIDPPAPLQLAREQHDRLIALGYPDNLLYQLSAQHGDSLATQPYAELYDATATLVGQARKMGLSAPDDIEMFALAGLLAHRDFIQHPSVQALLGELPENAPGSFAEAMRNLPQQAWADISAMRGAT